MFIPADFFSILMVKVQTRNLETGNPRENGLVPEQILRTILKPVGPFVKRIAIRFVHWIAVCFWTML